MPAADLRIRTVGPAFPFSAGISSPRGFDTSRGGALASTLGVLTLSGAGSLALDGTLTATLGTLTLTGVGVGTQVGFINRNVGPALPFQALSRGYSFGSAQASVGSVGVTLGLLTLTSDATVSQVPTVGQAVRAGFGPMMDFAPTPRGLTTPAATTGDLGTTLGLLTLNGTGSLGINGALGVTLGVLTLSGTASAGGASVGNLSSTLGALLLSSTATLTPLVYTPATVTVRAYKLGLLDGYRVIQPGTTFIVTTPYQFSPYWMEWVGDFPDDWIPILQVYSQFIDAELIRPLTSAEVRALLRQRPGPYFGRRR